MEMRKRVQLNDDELGFIRSYVENYYMALMRKARKEIRETVSNLSFPENYSPEAKEEAIKTLKRQIFKQKYEKEIKLCRKLLKKLNRALFGKYGLRAEGLEGPEKA